MYTVEFYVDGRGRSPVVEFLAELDKKARAKVAKWFEKLEREGPNLPRPYADILKGKIRELRVGVGSNQYRFLYFFVVGKRIIITHGFKKKTPAVPEAEISRAERYMEKILEKE